MQKKLLISLVTFFMMLGLNVSARAEVNTTQVTTNSYSDSFPHIKGNFLVWQGYVQGDWEIFLHNLTSGETVQITENDYDDMAPQTDGDYVVWKGYNRTGGEIFLYRIGEPVPLTDDGNAITNDDNVDGSPQIASGRVAWVSHEVTDSVEAGNIMLYEGGVFTQLTNSVTGVSTPRMSDDGVAWLEPDPDNRRNNFIYRYDFQTKSTSLSPNHVWDDPQSDGHLQVLTKYDGHDREVHILNRVKGTDDQITNNGVEDRYASISGNLVVWIEGEGQASEIFLAVYTYLAPVGPVDNAVLLKQPPSTFNWECIGYHKFKVEFSAEPDFPENDALVLPPGEAGWLSETSFTPTEDEWGAIRAIEVNNGNVYWRVAAKGENGSVSYSETWSFTIKEFGEAATGVANEDTDGSGGGPCFIGAAAFD